MLCGYKPDKSHDDDHNDDDNDADDDDEEEEEDDDDSDDEDDEDDDEYDVEDNEDDSSAAGDADYLYCWERVLIPIARQFKPQLTIISAGFDAARSVSQFVVHSVYLFISYLVTPSKVESLPNLVHLFVISRAHIKFLA